MKIQIAFEDTQEARYQRLKNVTFWALITVILTFTIVCINSCTIPIPAFAENNNINLDIISSIESNNNPLAISYRGAKYGRGLYQISEIALLDFNNAHPASKMPVDALYKPVEARKVAEWYISRIKEILVKKGIPVEINPILISWNWGVGNCIKWHKAGMDYDKLPKETQNFIKKYHKLERSAR